MVPFAEITLALRGAFRLARRDAGGMRDFNATIAGFWRSFVAALIVAPGYAIIIGPAIARLSPDNALLAVSVEIIAYVAMWAAFPLAMDHVARRIGRDAVYIRYIVAHNWSAVLQMIVFLAATLIGASMPAGAALFLHMLALGLILFYQWLVARIALEVNGALAAAIVGLGLVIEFAVTAAAALVSAPRV